jgi:FtsP/CotA-like multicopper oxidase with cupredoxin domain
MKKLKINKQLLKKVTATALATTLIAGTGSMILSSKAKAAVGVFFETVCDSVLSEGTCVAIFQGGNITDLVRIPFGIDPTDESALVQTVAGRPAVDLGDGFHAYHGALVGGPTETVDDAALTLNQQALGPANSFNIPSSGKPSPIFGAQPYSQNLLLFQEFGTEKLAAADNTATLPLPVAKSGSEEHDPIATKSQPDGAELEAFVTSPGLYPFPSRLSNSTMQNPWWNLVCDYLNKADCSHGGPMEGRPPGEGWSHQRWQEFYPEVFYKTAQAGARVNQGGRDSRQMHKFSVGEFAPGGLYHRGGTTSGISVKFHPNFPVQNHKSVWTFDGTMPPKLLMVRYGQPVLMRHFNALPIDVTANKGFGMHTLSTHEHNGHNPAESDGFAGAFFFPGQYYDYRWPLALAGHDTINTSATDPKAATPCVAGETLRVQRKNGPELVACDVSRDPQRKSGIINLRGDYRETMSTHWYHDHMIDFTSQNVYKGNGAMMNYYSAIDRGNESVSDGINLRLPSGSGLPWGNRDYDVNLIIGDKAWDAQGQLWFHSFEKDGFLGDQMLVNWGYKPKLDVRARKHRFRLLNGAVARYQKLALVKEVAGSAGEIQGPAGSNVSYNRVPFHMVANDGNIMEHAVAFDGTLGTEKGVLPTQAIGERYDIVVDFSKNGVKAGDKLYFVNILEHKDGKRPNKAIPLADVLSERYKAVIDGDRYINGDPAVGKFMRFDVVSCVDANNQAIACNDLSMDPAQYVAGKQKMLPRPVFTAQELQTARHRTFTFGKRGATDGLPWIVKTDGGQGYVGDTRRVSAAPNLGNVTPEGMAQVEIWHLEGGVGGWSHPVHVHFEEGQILNRDGAPVPQWERWARKDIFRIGKEVDSSSKMSVAYRFREFSGTYVEHCHNTTHEDHAMLVRWDIEKPGQTLLMPTPVPEWEGVHYLASVAEETFRSGKKIKDITAVDLNSVGATGAAAPAAAAPAQTGTVAAPVAEQETLTVTSARYDLRRGILQVAGKSSVSQGQSLIVHGGASASAPAVASIVVARDGSWKASIVTTRHDALSIVSSSGSALLNVPVSVR